MKRKSRGGLEIGNFSSHVEKYFTHLLSSLIKHFSTCKGKIHISMWPCNILYVYDVMKCSRTAAFTST